MYIEPTLIDLAVMIGISLILGIYAFHPKTGCSEWKAEQAKITAEKKRAYEEICGGKMS